MAAAAVAQRSNGVKPPIDSVDREAWEISQLEKIIEIRDQVFAGTHPRLKLLFPETIREDAGPEDDLLTSLRPPQVSQKTGSIAQPTQGSQNSSAIAKNSRLPPYPSLDTHAHASANASTAGAGASNIDPIFLTKSDVLLKAETQQKRQRIERALADQVKEQQKMSKQKNFDRDDLPDFNADEVLRRAQELVKPVRYADLKGADDGASASDSFDEKTFYSSQMNDSTPEAFDKPQPPRKPASTQKCNFYIRGDKCPYGDQCIYAHDSSPRPAGHGPRSPPTLVTRSNADAQASSRPSKPTFAQNCKYYINGDKCPYGEQCIYAHDPTTKGGPQMPKAQPEIATRSHADLLSSGSIGQQQTSYTVNATQPASQAERIAELEAQLRTLKSQQDDRNVGPSKINTRKALEAQDEESVYSPPDAVPQKASEIAIGKRKEFGERQRRSSAQIEGSSREYPRRVNPARSPAINEGHVVRSHITSPLAPQPARVSPLAVAKAPQITQGQRQPRPMNDSFYNSQNGPSPAQNIHAQPQASNPKKRKKGRDSNEHIRNVIPRRAPPSPDIRIKEEPLSPPPFAEPADAWQPRRQEEFREPIYVDEPSPRYQNGEGVTYRTRVIDRPAPRYPLDHYREPPSSMYEPELRRVVSTRQAQASLAGIDRYPSPQLLPARAVSQVYIPGNEVEMRRQYRGSIQPEPLPYVEREHPPSPMFREAPPMMMAPPPRRIVVDQHGNQFYEQEVASMPRPTQSSALPSLHSGPPDRSLSSPAPRHSIARIPQPFGDESRYIRRGVSPPPPRYVEYISPTHARVPLNRNVEMAYGNEIQPRRADGADMVEYAQAHLGGVHEEARPMEGIARVPTARPVSLQHNGVAERVARVQSVHPEGRRVVSVGGELAPRASRHMSMRPEEGYVRPFEYVQPRVQYYSGPDAGG